MWNDLHVVFRSFFLTWQTDLEAHFGMFWNESLRIERTIVVIASAAEFEPVLTRSTNEATFLPFMTSPFRILFKFM